MEREIARQPYTDNESEQKVNRGPYAEMYTMRESLDINIEVLPERNLELCIVIPARKELEKGSFFRSLESLSRQTAPMDSFEVLYVVNNTLQDSKEQNNTFAENQLLLKIIAYINGSESSLPADLNQYSTSIINAAKEKGLRVRAIDYSTRGNPDAADITDPTQKKGVGFARYAGIVAAKERLTETAKLSGRRNVDSLIAHLDADCVVNARYVQKRIDFFRKNPEKNTQFLNVDLFTATGDQEHFASTFRFQLAYHLYRLATLFGGADAIGGGQIVSRAPAYEEFEPKFLNKIAGEDHEIALGLFLQRRFNFSGGDIDVHAEDRKPVIADFGGMSSFRGDEFNDSQSVEEQMIASFGEMKDYLYSVFADGEGMELEHFIRRSEKYSEAKTNWIRTIMQNLLSNAYNLQEDFRTFIENDDLLSEITRVNPWMISYLDTLRTSMSQNEAQEKLVEDFPDYMKPLSKTPMRQYVAQAMGFISFLQVVFTDTYYSSLKKTLLQSQERRSFPEKNAMFQVYKKT